MVLVLLCTNIWIHHIYRGTLDLVVFCTHLPIDTAIYNALFTGLFSSGLFNGGGGFNGNSNGNSNGSFNGSFNGTSNGNIINRRARSGAAIAALVAERLVAKKGLKSDYHSCECHGRDGGGNTGAGSSGREDGSSDRGDGTSGREGGSSDRGDGSNVSGGGGESEGIEWACEACTFVNVLAATECDCCGNMKTVDLQWDPQRYMRIVYIADVLID
jgi:hypothetical protein